MPESRRARVAAVLHGARTEGLTIAELAEQAEVPKSVVKEILLLLLKRHQAILMAARRNPATNTLEEVWGCRCRLPHRRVNATTDAAFGPVVLDDDTRARGIAGVDAARAALDAALDAARRAPRTEATPRKVS